MYHHNITNALSRVFLAVFMLFGVSIEATWARSPGQDALDKGSDHYLNGAFQDAALAFKQATELDPALLSAWKNLGWAYRKLQRASDALAIWETVLKIEPRHFEILNEMAEIYSEQGEFKQAVTHYEKSLHLTPQQPQVHLRVGDAYKALGYIEPAIEHFELAALQREHQESAYARIVATYESQGQVARAREFLETLAGAQGLSAGPKQQLARLYAKQGDTAYQRGDFAQASRLFTAATRWSSTAQYQVSLGWALRKQGKLAEAIQAWLLVIDTQSEPKAIYTALGDAYRELGDTPAAQSWYEKAFQQGNDKSAAALRLAANALQRAERATALRWIDAWLDKAVFGQNQAKIIANLFILNDKIDWGIEDLAARLPRGHAQTAQMAQTINHSLALLYIATAEAAFQSNDYTSAAERYQRALSYNPTNADALRDLGWAFWRLQRWDDCQRAWEAYARAYPASIEPQNLFTQFYFYRKEYRAAISHATQSLSLAPKQPQQQLKLAKALYLDNQFSKARTMARKLAVDQPDNLDAQVFQAELISRYQHHAEAKPQWEKVLRLDPGSVRARFMWLRSRYELGEYDAAITGVKEIIATQGPSEATLRWLAEDASTRNDRSEAAHWLQRLVEFAPERPGYWLDLAGAHLNNNDRKHSRATLELAQAQHPQNAEILQALADDDLSTGNYQRALLSYRDILTEYPSHRPAYAGRIYALIATKKYAEALALLDTGTQQFWKDYDLDLLRSSILFNVGEDARASDLLEKITAMDERAIYIPILLYHGISTNPRNEKTISLAQLDSQFKALHDAGYTTITVSEFTRIVDGKQKTPPKPILITFDDARNDSLELSDPLLQKYNFTASMFVPTAEIVDHHPFYADWATLKKYQESGRWDFQSHGHRAHELIPLDRGGNSGGFLVNRSWLSEQQRLETLEEYSQRLDDDYFTSIRLLEENLPGPVFAVYAFPYSEAGQQRVGNVATSYETNLRLLVKHFRFGAVQDQSGYNLINVGIKVGSNVGHEQSQLLRRFAVPRNMDGAQLLQHLAAKHPHQMARLTRAEMTYWQGRYETARQQFADIDTQSGMPEQKKHYFLASIAARQGRDRPALLHINTAVRNATERSENLITAHNNILWSNRTSLSLRYDQQQDSDQRSLRATQTQFRFPLVIPLDLTATLGTTTLQERDTAQLRLDNVNIGFRWCIAQTMGISAELRTQRSDAETATTAGLLQLSYEFDRIRTQFQFEREDIMTVPAQLAELQANAVSTRVDMRVSRFWSAHLTAAMRRYDDDNTRHDLRISANYTVPQLQNLQLGLVASYSDAVFTATEYYSPSELGITQMVANYRNRMANGWVVSGQVGAGLASETPQENRFAYNLSTEVVKYWLDHLRTPLTVKYQDTANYQHWSADIGVDYRF